MDVVDIFVNSSAYLLQRAQLYLDRFSHLRLIFDSECSF